MPHTPEQEGRTGPGRAGTGTGTAPHADGRRQKETISDPAGEQKPAPPPPSSEKEPDQEQEQEQEQEGSEDVYSLRPMQPILRLSQYGLSRGGVALPGRRLHNQHSYGYMSDTDAVAEEARYDAVLDGYMSEDGLYARNPPQVKYSSVGGETSLWRVEAQQKTPAVAAMAADRPAYYSYTDAPGSSFLKQRMAHPSDQNRLGRKDPAPEFKQISNTQWKRAVEGRRPPGDLTSAVVAQAPAPDPRRERSATPVSKHKRENGAGTPEPSASPAAAAAAAAAAASAAAATAAESPNLKFSRQKLRKSATYAKRPTSQTSVSSAGSSGLPPKDPEHRPRTKVKVSGSTQTTAELLGGEQELAARRLQQLKSYSLTGPAAQQLSQSVRERILAGGGEHTFSTLPSAGRERGPRVVKASDGSLSDSNYGSYGDPRRQMAQRPSSAYTAYVGQQLAKTFRGSMTEAESMESVSSGASGLLAQLQQQRSGSLTQNRLLTYQWEGQAGQSPRLSRSNSIRSTKSEKLYSNLLQRGGSDEDPFYSALVSGRGEPPSPSPSPSRASFPLSPMTGRGSYGARSTKDDDAHGSSLSLVSTTSSIYSAQEEKQASETRRLKRDLLESQEKVQTLTNQLTTNAHVVEAFEQSLTSMTKKLHQITLTSEQKDKDVAEMRRQIDRLQRALAASGGSQSASLTRQTSNESISSLSSACSVHSQQSSRTPDSPGSHKKKKKGWFSASPQLRSSFGKAFSRRKPKTGSDMEDTSAPSSPVMAARHGGAAADQPDTPARAEEPSSAGPVEDDLRRQLREKDTALTDMRLEALSSHHQLETLKETVNRIRKEMACMRQDNERLQRLVASRSANSSRSSLAAEPGERPLTAPSPTAETAPRLEEAAAPPPAPASADQKALVVGVRMGGEQCPVGAVTVGRKTVWDVLDDAVRRTFKEYLCRLDPDQSLGIDTDAITGYRLGEVSRALTGGAEPPELMPWGYTIGDVRQAELSLRGHREGCVDAFVFETLIPKPIVHRYISILLEHRRVILCGQSGTGKTYLARRLAEYLVRRSGASAAAAAAAATDADAVATVTVEPGGSRELHQYLTQLSERCRQPDAALPHVLILDNLHHVQAPADVFNGFLSTAHTDPRCPYIIGTMSQPAGASTDLQLHHNFRWVLCANHVEPVRGFLGRHLRRRLASAELASGTHDPQLRLVFEWVPRVWQQLNKFLETHSSADVTMGPRLLLNCPCDLTASQVWFTGVWNYSIVPYLVETVREGLLIYGRRASWHDPTQFVLDTYPWQRAAPHAGVDSLTRLRPEDVGYDAAAPAGATLGRDAPPPAPAERRAYKDSDPLLSMLMSLQEAANYSVVPGRVSSAATTPERAPEQGRRQAGGQATL
ncbi:protein sickie-like isoform X2 [Pollicipes pollicipes]|uniref:protein sickie-like isoform X2 n=1 Tax=Pollicipes pollicipes TaxID=41117 RepID=UPI0018852376|nr:protein sickie-like isoform X2 [Pollicipes pollicipes]